MDRERIRQIANECGLPPGGEYASWTEIAHFGWTVALESEKRISALEEENQKLKALLTDILDAHHLAEVDWDAMREAEKMIGYTFTLDDAESGTPYGCKCKTLHHRVTGDGCHICNPPESGEKRNINGSLE